MKPEESYRMIGIKFYRDPDTGEIDYKISPVLVSKLVSCREGRYLTEIGPDHVTEFIIQHSTEDTETAIDRLKNHILKGVDQEINKLKKKRETVRLAVNSV